MTDQEFDDFAEDILGERAFRPLLIVASSKIDELLLHVLQKRLLAPTDSGTNRDELLIGDNPLGTFSARIRAVYRLGIVDRTLHDALQKLRMMRNLCAHTVKLDETATPMSSHVQDLRRAITNRKSHALTKDRFFPLGYSSSLDEIKCMLLTMCVVVEAVKKQTPVLMPLKKTLSISAR